MDVGGFNPSEKIFVSWDDYSQYMGKQKNMFQTTNQLYTSINHSRRPFYPRKNHWDQDWVQPKFLGDLQRVGVSNHVMLGGLISFVRWG